MQFNGLGLMVKTFETELSCLSVSRSVLFYGSRLSPLHRSQMSQDSVTNVNIMCTEQKRTPVAWAEANRNQQRK